MNRVHFALSLSLIHTESIPLSRMTSPIYFSLPRLKPYKIALPLAPTPTPFSALCIRSTISASLQKAAGQFRQHTKKVTRVQRWGEGAFFEKN